MSNTEAEHKMENCGVLCAAEHGPNTNDSLEQDGSSRDEIHELNELMKDVTGLIQIATESQKQAELAHHYMEEALRRSTEVLNCSQMVFQASCQFGNHLLNQKDLAGWRELHRRHRELSSSYGALLGALRNAKVLSHVKTADEGSRPRMKSPSAQAGHTENGEDAARSHRANEKMSHHKQLETVRSEEHMGGTFLIQRRRSPLHSPSSSADGVSPLLSNDEVNVMKPIAQYPSNKDSGRFSNKVIHQKWTQEGSDSDAVGTKNPSP